MAKFALTKNRDYINLDKVKTAYRQKDGDIVAVINESEKHVIEDAVFEESLATIIPACESDVAIIASCLGDGAEPFTYRVKIVAWRVYQSFVPQPVFATEGIDPTYDPTTVIGVVRPDGGVSISNDTDFSTIDEFMAHVKVWSDRLYTHRMKKGGM